MSLRREGMTTAKQKKNVLPGGCMQAVANTLPKPRFPRTSRPITIWKVLLRERGIFGRITTTCRRTPASGKAAAKCYGHRKQFLSYPFCFLFLVSVTYHSFALNCLACFLQQASNQPQCCANKNTRICNVMAKIVILSLKWDNIMYCV